jgi:DNA topoisomerase I
MKLTLTERIIEDEGYRRAYKAASKAGDPATLKAGQESRLASLQTGQRVKPKQVRVRKAGTPEFGLIKLLEKRGIGRPATYASILDSLHSHRYIERAANGELRLTKRGQGSLGFLTNAYPTLFALEFTAQMEAWLDAVASGEMEYEQAVGQVWAQVNLHSGA